MIAELAMGVGAAAIVTSIYRFFITDRRDSGQKAREVEARRITTAPLALLMKTDDPDLRTALSDFVERTAGRRPSSSNDTHEEAVRQAMLRVGQACLRGIENPAGLAKPGARRDLADNVRQTVQLLHDPARQPETRS